MTPQDFITLHLGSRQPKWYKPGTAGPGSEAQLADDQKDAKCRIKLRFVPETPLRVMAREAQIQWSIHDRGAKPAWIAGTDAKAVQAIALMLEIGEVREWAPAEGDD